MSFLRRHRPPVSTSPPPTIPRLSPDKSDYAFPPTTPRSADRTILPRFTPGDDAPADAHDAGAPTPTYVGGVRPPPSRPDDAVAFSTHFFPPDGAPPPSPVPEDAVLALAPPQAPGARRGLLSRLRKAPGIVPTPPWSPGDHIYTTSIIGAWCRHAIVISVVPGGDEEDAAQMEESERRLFDPVVVIADVEWGFEAGAAEPAGDPDIPPPTGVLLEEADFSLEELARASPSGSQLCNDYYDIPPPTGFLVEDANGSPSHTYGSVPVLFTGDGGEEVSPSSIGQSDWYAESGVGTAVSVSDEFPTPRRWSRMPEIDLDESASTAPPSPPRSIIGVPRAISFRTKRVPRATVQLHTLPPPEFNLWRKVTYPRYAHETGVGKYFRRSPTHPPGPPVDDPVPLILARVRFLLSHEHLLPQSHHHFQANAECIAVWVRTGRWSTAHGSHFLAVTAAGQVKSAVTAGAYAATPTITVPASGMWGYLGYTTKVTLASALPWVMPAVAGYGIVTVGAPLLILSRSKAVWEEVTKRLNGEFWKSEEGLESVVACVEYWSGLVTHPPQGDEEHTKKAETRVV